MDDKPDNITRDPPPPPVNEAEVERMRQVKIIQQQTNEANAARVAKFGAPRYLGPNAATRAAEFQNLRAAFNRRVPSVTTPILKGGRAS